MLPVYLQVVLGLNALETGLRLLPMSVTMLIAALTGPKLAARRSPKAVCRLGLVAISVAAVVLLATLDIELNDVGFLVGLAVFGVGAGLLASQLGNVIISAAPPAQTNEAGGLQGTAQNLGASLGTALIGAILLIGPDERVRGPDHGERGAPRRGADEPSPRRRASRVSRSSRSRRSSSS